MPWPSGYPAIIGKLEVLSFNFVPAFSASCLFPRANFYTTLLTSTAGPIAVVAAILAYYLARLRSTRWSETDEAGESDETSRRGKMASLQAKAASSALAVSYLAFPGASLTTFRLFARDWKFPDGQCFLKYDYSCSCTSQTYSYWQAYGAS